MQAIPNQRLMNVLGEPTIIHIDAPDAPGATQRIE